jgi:hypothetical protein
MANIICPNKQYTGISATVAFANGEGKTDNEHLIKWFEIHGYTVDFTPDEPPKDDGKRGKR